MRVAVVAVLAMLAGVVPPAPAQDAELVVSAAASLSDVMTELTTLYLAESRVALRVNSGGSNTLARQIVEGAGVDVFISADEAQMEVAEQAGRLVPGSRSNLVSNALVVIVPTQGMAGASSLRVTAAKDLTRPGVRRIAMGNPESVPAGVYGRRWLEALGLWATVRQKVVPLPTVRAALSAVQEGRADAGIVYATDARVTPDVRVAMTVPAGEAPAIVYPAAAVRGPREAPARQFLVWLRGGAAQAVFMRAGFGPVAPAR